MNERGELVIQTNDNKMQSWNFIIKFPFVYTYIYQVPGVGNVNKIHLRKSNYDLKLLFI